MSELKEAMTLGDVRVGQRFSRPCFLDVKVTHVVHSHRGDGQVIGLYVADVEGDGLRRERRVEHGMFLREWSLKAAAS